MASSFDFASPKPAGFWVRFAARTVDGMIVLIPLSIMGVWAVMTIPGFNQYGPMFRFAAAVPSMIYTLGFWMWRGATPGKMLFSLVIVRDSDYRSASVGQLVGRYFSYILSALPLGLGYMWVGWDSRKQGFHDHLAHTLVIKRPNASNQTGRTVLGIVAVCVLLICMLVVGGKHWISQNKDRWKQEGLQVKAEAAEFGKTHNAQQCLDEALHRSDQCTGFKCHTLTDIFLRNALKTSQATPGFCDGVPPKTDIMRTATWQNERCRQMGRAQDTFCGNLVREIQKHCTEDAPIAPTVVPHL